MLGFKLNHVSKRGQWSSLYDNIVGMFSQFSYISIYLICVHINICWGHNDIHLIYLFNPMSIARCGTSFLSAGISMGMRPANERRRYNVTTSLIDWAHT